MRKLHIDIGQFILGLTVILLLILVVYPLGKVFLKSFIYEGKFSFENFIEIAQKPGNYRALLHSIEVAFISTIFAIIIGTILAWLVARTDLPMRKFLQAAFLFPFIIPPFIGAIAWIQLIGPYGYVSRLLMGITGSTKPLFNIYGRVGTILVLTIYGYPYVYLNALGGLERMNPELEEAAQISGSPIFTVMKDITLPLMTPTIVAGSLLAFIYSIANFGIPMVMGFSANYFVLTTKIYDAITGTLGKPNFAIASSLSLVLAVIAGSVLLLKGVILKGKKYTVLSGKSMQPNIVRLGKYKSLMLGICLFLVFITTIAPLMTILLTALTKAYGLAPLPNNWTLKNFYNVLVLMPSSRRSVRNSFILAMSAATIIAFFGALIAYIIVKTKMRFRNILDFFSNIPYTIPGTVVAIAMILAWMKFKIPFTNVGFSLYNTIWILLVAYIARYLAFGVRATSGSLEQVHDSLEEAAFISGANWLQSFKDIIIPLIAPGLFASWFLVFIPSLRELTLSALLYSVKNETIGVVVFNLQEQGSPCDSAALAVIMLAVLFTANYVLRKITKGQFGY